MVTENPGFRDISVIIFISSIYRPYDSEGDKDHNRTWNTSHFLETNQLKFGNLLDSKSILHIVFFFSLSLQKI